MGLLNFIVNQTNRVLPKYLKEGNAASDVLLAGRIATVLSSKDAYSIDEDSNGKDEDSDDESVNDSDIEIDVDFYGEDGNDNDNE